METHIVDGVHGELIRDSGEFLDIEDIRPSFFRPPPADDAMPLLVEAVSSRALIGHQTAWADLCARALEPNVFLEPAFALPLLQHVDPHSRPDVLLVWEENGPTSFGRLVGLMPVALARGPLAPPARGFRDKQIALGTPLLDADRGAEAFEAMLDWLGKRPLRNPALILTNIALDGPFHQLATRICTEGARPLHYFESHSRAVLRAPDADHAALVTLASAKRRKEWRRQARRLSALGSRTYASATTPSAIAQAIERFLVLEHNGWKGRRGTSLLADPRLATFLRSMARQMAHEGKCRVDTIEIDGIAVAMGIVLTVGTRAYFWKTAFDERFAAYSPGVQFTHELALRQLADPQVAMTDSCAQPNHPMIDRLWSDRMPVADVMIGVGTASGFARSRRQEGARRALRDIGKRLVGRLRRLAGR